MFVKCAENNWIKRCSISKMSSFIVYLHSFVVYYIFSHYRIDYLVYLSKQASFYLIMILLKLALINRLFLMQPVSISSLLKDFMKLFHYYWANFLIFLSFYFFTDKNMWLSIEKRILKIRMVLEDHISQYMVSSLDY